ncbi:mycothiol-dependent maleylpyruvate isomerase NagL [soil metagenome]
MTRTWVREGTAVFLDAVGRLPDDELDRPSRLPDWTRRTVIAHVARNADALVNLLTWARTGVETPMYASPEERTAGIAETARLGSAQLHADLAGSAQRLQDAAGQLTDEQWQYPVRTAQGREIPAEQVPWMRTREVWIHAVDLGVGIGMDDLPADVVDALIVDVLAMFGARGEDLDAVLVPSDRPDTWTSGAGGTEVRGSAADLSGWLTGRLGDDSQGQVQSGGGALPDVPRWL